MKMKIRPICFDSFSVRSMSTVVETDIKILIDPGVALGPLRYGLPPSKLEEEAFERGRRKIITESIGADILVVSHYHYDHYPFPDDIEMNQIFKGNLVLVKGVEKINKSQKSREQVFEKMIKDKATIKFADGKTFEIGNTTIKISEPVPHGPENTRLGYVVMTNVLYKNKSFLHASDVQGPISRKTAQMIIKNNPDFLILDGPPTYLAGYRMPFNIIKQAEENVKEIVSRTKVKTVILDHHLLRDINYRRKFDVFDFSNDLGCSVKTAAEFLGIKNKLLEAHRKDYSSS